MVPIIWIPHNSVEAQCVTASFHWGSVPTAATHVSSWWETHMIAANYTSMLHSSLILIIWQLPAEEPCWVLPIGVNTITPEGEEWKIRSPRAVILDTNSHPMRLKDMWANQLKRIDMKYKILLHNLYNAYAFQNKNKTKKY